MTLDPSSLHAKPDVQALTAGLLASSLCANGEVEIAGRLYVTNHRLAQILNVTPRTAARWNAARIGPPKISVGKTVLYDVAKLPDWLASLEGAPVRNKRG
jgi:hypothetical protein